MSTIRRRKHRALRGGSFNLRVRRDPRVVRDEVERLVQKWDLDFLCVQESTEYRTVLGKIDGYLYFTRGAEGVAADAEVGVLVRSGITVGNFKVDAEGDGWYGRMTRGRMRPRVFARVTLNGWLRLGNVHMPPTVDLASLSPRDRYEDYVALAGRIVRFLRVPWKARLVVADWNASPANHAQHAPQHIARQARASLEFPDNAGIDGAIAKRCRVSHIFKDRVIHEASDHEPVVFLVEAL